MREPPRRSYRGQLGPAWPGELVGLVLEHPRPVPAVLPPDLALEQWVVDPRVDAFAVVVDRPEVKGPEAPPESIGRLQQADALTARGELSADQSTGIAHLLGEEILIEAQRGCLARREDHEARVRKVRAVLAREHGVVRAQEVRHTRPPFGADRMGVRVEKAHELTAGLRDRPVEHSRMVVAGPLEVLLPPPGPHDAPRPVQPRAAPPRRLRP